MPAKITAAPTSVRLNGREFSFSPLTDRDLDEVDEWLHARMLRIARSSMTADMSQIERDETMRIAMQEAAACSHNTRAGVAMLASLPGVAFLAFLSIRRGHPDIKYEDIREWVSGGEGIAEINAAFAQVNYAKAKETSEGARKNQKRASK